MSSYTSNDISTSDHVSVGMNMRSSDQSFTPEASPVRRLGQNFLIDAAVRERMLDVADVSKSDVVLEVGPGTGFLTEALIASAGKVIVVEKDPRLVILLKRKHERSKRLRIIEGDVLKVKLPHFNKVVCSPPYYISSRLVLLLVSKKIRSAVLTLQKEFAERLAAKPGSPDYGRISVMVQHKSSVELVRAIARDSFKPVPRVDSMVVVIRRKRPEVHVKSERFFTDMVRFLFTQRRKKASKVLRQYIDTLPVDKGAKGRNVPSLPDARVFQLTVADFERLSNDVYSMTVSKR